MKKNKKGLKKVLKNTLFAIIGLGYTVKCVLHFIDKTIPRLFMKMPRIFRQLVIYSMVILSVMCFIGRNNGYISYAYNIEARKIISVEVSTKPAEKPSKCEMSDIECSIFEESKKQGLTDEQAYIVLAISKHETGHWTSWAFTTLNNIGGIMCGDGLRTYDTLQEGIEDTVSILKLYYFDLGLDTLEKIQPKYCPIGADNDPSGLNNYWLKNTKIFYEEYLRLK